ncbi:MAG: hypothetical protein DWQ05_21685 [Calditrichaeota bacterium]|nr:MAG: hypothetical protein DWQ05_21685 [Calditrichota bacterium]
MQKPRNYSEWYSRYLEGELSAGEKRSLENYLEKNPQEKQNVEQLAALRSNLSQLQSIKISDDFETVLRARIQMEKKIGQNSFFSFFQEWRAPALGIASALLLFIAFSLYNSNPNDAQFTHSAAEPTKIVSSTPVSPASDINYTLDHFSAPPGISRTNAHASNLSGNEFSAEGNQHKTAVDSTAEIPVSNVIIVPAHVQYTY